MILNDSISIQFSTDFVIDLSEVYMCSFLMFFDVLCMFLILFVYSPTSFSPKSRRPATPRLHGQNRCACWAEGVDPGPNWESLRPQRLKNIRQQQQQQKQQKQQEQQQEEQDALAWRLLKNMRQMFKIIPKD